MATQRVTVAKIGGRTAELVAALFQRWQRSATENRTSSEALPAIDMFAEQLRAHAHLPPIVYFAEWVDQWSMGDLVPGLGDDRAVVVAGRRFEACCHHPPISLRVTTISGKASQETLWLKVRLNEAEDAWKDLTSNAVIVVLREPLGALVTDEELVESLGTIPAWLQTVPG